MPAGQPTADPDRFDEAIRAWRRRAPISDDDLAILDDEELAHAFKVAGVTEARVLEDVFDALDRAIEQGTTLEDFQADAGELLFDAWGAEDSPRLEAIFRTNVLSAYAEGREEIFNDPAVREARPYKQYRAVGDNRDCEICDPLDGTVLPADDAFWAGHKVPLHIQCRCEVVALTPEEAADEGIDDGAPDHEPPADGFGKGQDYEPDLSSFDPGIASVLRDRLK
jgi:SPP1 gp7 family putative phage head morphogenesis protein